MPPKPAPPAAGPQRAKTPAPPKKAQQAAPQQKPQPQAAQKMGRSRRAKPSGFGDGGVGGAIEPPPPHGPGPAKPPRERPVDGPTIIPDNSHDGTGTFNGNGRRILGGGRSHTGDVLGTFEATEKTQANAIAAAFTAELLGPRYTDDPVPLPDSNGCMMETAWCDSMTALNPVTVGGGAWSGQRWMGIVAYPGLQDTTNGNYAKIKYLSAVDPATGVITWTTYSGMGGVEAGIKANAAAARMTALGLTLLDNSSEVSRGGIMYTARLPISNRNADPTTLDSVMSNIDLYAVSDFEKQTLDGAFTLPWMYCTPPLMMSPATDRLAYEGEYALVALVRLPAFGAGAAVFTQLYNYRLVKKVDFVPATAILGPTSTPTINALEEMSSTIRMVEDRTGVSIANSPAGGSSAETVPSLLERAAKYAWALASRYAHHIPGLIERYGQYALGSKLMMGKRSASAKSQRLALQTNGPTPEALAAHYGSVARGQPSQLIAHFLNSQRANPRFSRRSIDEYVDSFEAAATAGRVKRIDAGHFVSVATKAKMVSARLAPRPAPLAAPSGAADIPPRTSRDPLDDAHLDPPSPASWTRA